MSSGLHIGTLPPKMLKTYPCPPDWSGANEESAACFPDASSSPRSAGQILTPQIPTQLHLQQTSPPQVSPRCPRPSQCPRPLIPARTLTLEHHPNSLSCGCPALAHPWCQLHSLNDIQDPDTRNTMPCHPKVQSGHKTPLRPQLGPTWLQAGSANHTLTLLTTSSSTAPAQWGQGRLRSGCGTASPLLDHWC